jgi:hypothetical protein
VDLLVVRNDEEEEEEEVSEFREDESAPFLRAQRVIACSNRVARAPIRPPARRKELDDVVEKKF